MSIPVEGGYRSIISETLLNIRRRQAQVKALTEELEATAQAAASFQKVDLAEFHLDVDKLEFTERPKQPQPPFQPEPEIEISYPLPPPELTEENKDVPELVAVNTDGEYPYLTPGRIPVLVRE